VHITAYESWFGSTEHVKLIRLNKRVWQKYGNWHAVDDVKM